jgi:hypothetical protein
MVALFNNAGKLILMRYRESPWARIVLRRPVGCCICGVMLTRGEEAFRPLDNSLRRMDRMCPPCATKVGM